MRRAETSRRRLVGSVLHRWTGAPRRVGGGRVSGRGGRIVIIIVAIVGTSSRDWHAPQATNKMATTLDTTRRRGRSSRRANNDSQIGGGCATCRGRRRCWFLDVVVVVAAQEHAECGLLLEPTADKGHRISGITGIIIGTSNATKRLQQSVNR